MDNILKLKKEVLKRQKILAGVYRDFGKKSLFDYANSWPIPAPCGQTEIFAGHLKKALLKIYPQALAEEVYGQFLRQPLVSTIDHHGILNHPFFVNSNLIFSLKNNNKYLLCLSTAGVSLNNSSWPGCLFLTDADGYSKRFSFFPDKIKTQTVLSAPAIKPEEFKKVFYQIQNYNGLGLAEKQNLEILFNESFNYPEIQKGENFSDQACLISQQLWQRFFPDAPKVIYLPVEGLISQILTQTVLLEPEHFLHKLFFTPQGARLIEKYFDKNPGAFLSDHKGSFLFWHINKKGRRVHLHRAGENIEGDGYSLGLRPESVNKALEQNKVYPTSLVCFLVLLYYGITCLGGFNQVNWLAGIKEKFLLLLKETGEKELAGKISRAVTNNFAEGNLAFLVRGKSLIKASGLDVYLGGENLYQRYVELSKKLTVAESMESLLPEIYRVVTPAQDRQAKLLAITDQTIAAQNGLAEKVHKVLK
jgi:hypothetical protein